MREYQVGDRVRVKDTAIGFDELPCTGGEVRFDFGVSGPAGVHGYGVRLDVNGSDRMFFAEHELEPAPDAGDFVRVPGDDDHGDPFFGTVKAVAGKSKIEAELRMGQVVTDEPRDGTFYWVEIDGGNVLVGRLRPPVQAGVQGPEARGAHQPDRLPGGAVLDVEGGPVALLDRGDRRGLPPSPGLADMKVVARSKRVVVTCVVTVPGECCRTTPLDVRRYVHNHADQLEICDVELEDYDEEC